MAGRVASPRLNLETLRRDVSAGVVAAVVSLPQTVPMGVIAFAPLGSDWLWLGVLASLYSSVFAGLVAALAGGSPLMVSGPRASSALIMAGMAAALMADPGVAAHGGAPVAATLLFATVLLAGVGQVVFGVSRLGRFVKYVPYPVIAGFMNGVAVLIFLGQVGALLGMRGDVGWARALSDLGAARPAALAVGLVAVAAMVWTPKVTKAVPGAMAGMIVGLAAFHAAAPFLAPGALGAVVGAIPAATPSLGALSDMIALAGEAWALEALLGIAPAIGVLAVVGSIESLLSAVAADTVAGTRHDSDRELVGQGLSNIVAALFGGMSSTGSLARTLASIKAGARGRAAAVVCALLTLFVTVLMGPWMAWLPLAAMGGVMVVIAWSALDAWSIQMVRRLSGPVDHRREIVANLLVVAAVAVITVAVNLVAAVVFGIAASMVMFVTKMTKPIVRSIADGRTRRSLKVRGRTASEFLAEHGHEISVVELDGPLFFGTADDLMMRIESGCAQARLIILDFRRVSGLDATGARILNQIGRSIWNSDRALVIANVDPGSPLGGLVREMGGAHMSALVRFFPDTDHALEWAEDRLLSAHGLFERSDREVALEDLPLLASLSEDEQAAVRERLRRIEAGKGAVLFRRGEPGECLFLLVKGEVTIQLPRPDGAPLRLATFTPGAMFGEMALLEWQPRSADAVCDQDVVAYSLSAEDFSALMSDNPKVAQSLALGLARDLAARLRVTSEQVRAAA